MQVLVEHVHDLSRLDEGDSAASLLDASSGVTLIPKGLDSLAFAQPDALKNAT